MRFANLTLFRRPFRGGAGDWRITRDTVGSWILEEPIHYIDLLLWYFRERGLPVEVSASGLPSPRGPRHDRRLHRDHDLCRRQLRGVQRSAWRASSIR